MSLYCYSTHTTMHVYLNLMFLVILFFNCGECISESSPNAGFRSIKTGPKPLWSETTLDKLKKDLLINYDKYARPEQHYNSTTVKIGMSIIHLETDELKSRITLNAWMRMIWTDSKLKWNETDYGDISVARLSDHEIWQPDIYLYNSASGGEPITRFSNPNVLIYPNGEVLWVPPAKLTALCKFNLRYWPFDTQHCNFKFGSWTHNGNEIKLELYNNQHYVDIEYGMVWSAWNISNSTAEVAAKYYDCCTEPYYHVEFNITLVRKSGPYKAIIVTPAVVISLLILMQFWLPPHSEEKLILNGFIVVTIVMFLTYFTDQISVAGSNTPLIVIFYSSSFYIICFSIAATTAVLSLSKMTKSQCLPWAIRKHFQGKLGKLLLLEYKLEETSVNESYQAKGHLVSEFGSSYTDRCHMQLALKKYNEENWILQLAIDRILFIIYSFVVLTIIIAYLI